MTTSTTVLAITDIFERGGPPAPGLSRLKNGRAFKKWLNKLADALKRLSRNVAEAFCAIAEKVVGAILSFLGKVVGFVDEYTRAFTVFAVGLIVVWLMQKVKTLVL